MALLTKGAVSLGKKVFHGLLMLLCFVLPITALCGLRGLKKSVSFPHRLSGTDLTITRLVLCRSEESGRLGLIAKNVGKKYLSYISVKVRTDMGTFCFETNYLPPGERAVLWDITPVESIPPILDVSAEVIHTYSPFLPEGKVIVSEDGEDFWVENRTGETIPSLWVYYGAYDAQQALYWGAAHITSVPDLQPGEKRFLPLKQDGEYPPKVIGCRQK